MPRKYEEFSDSLFAALTRIGERAKTLQGIIAAISAALLLGVSTYEKQPRVIALGALFFVVYCIYIGWTSRPRGLPPITVFVGPAPMTESDSASFFGREQDITDLLSRLEKQDLSYLVLYGESGSGKTSLIRAGLIPRLNHGASFPGVYLRFGDRPIERLRAALRLVAADKVDALPARAVVLAAGGTSDETVTLFEELKLARIRAGAPLVLFLDQFEELFTHPAPADERRAFQEFFQTVLSRADTARVVVSIRQDFLDQLAHLETPDTDLLSKKARHPLATMTLTAARQIIEATLHLSPENSVSWTDGLIDRVLEDLAIERNVGGRDSKTVLPAELQIVCQMVQRWGLYEARSYPGKLLLIHAYVRKCIDEAPKGPEHALQVLLALTHDNKLTRAEPQSAAVIALRAGVSESEVQVLLRRFEEAHRIVTSVSVVTHETLQYELSHEYLVRTVIEVAGASHSPRTRSKALLEVYRTQTALNPRLQVPLSDCIYIWRHPPGTIGPEDRQLLARSVRWFALRFMFAVILPSAFVVILRQGTIHIDRAYEEGSGLSRGPRLVIKRGLPFLHPLLGSNTILFDLGLNFAELDEEAYRAATERRWFIDAFPGARRTWSHQIAFWVESKAWSEIDPSSSNYRRAFNAIDSLGRTNSIVDLFRDRYLSIMELEQPQPAHGEYGLDYSNIIEASQRFAKASPSDQHTLVVAKSILNATTPLTPYSEVDLRFVIALVVLTEMNGIDDRTFDRIASQLTGPEAGARAIMKALSQTKLQRREFRQEVLARIFFWLEADPMRLDQIYDGETTSQAWTLAEHLGERSPKFDALLINRCAKRFAYNNARETACNLMTKLHIFDAGIAEMMESTLLRSVGSGDNYLTQSRESEAIDYLLAVNSANAKVVEYFRKVLASSELRKALTGSYSDKAPLISNFEQLQQHPALARVLGAEVRRAVDFYIRFYEAPPDDLKWVMNRELSGDRMNIESTSYEWKALVKLAISAGIGAEWIVIELERGAEPLDAQIDPLLAAMDVVAPKNPLGPRALAAVKLRPVRRGLRSDEGCVTGMLLARLGVRDRIFEKELEECGIRYVSSNYRSPSDSPAHVYAEAVLAPAGQTTIQNLSEIKRLLESSRADLDVGYRGLLAEALLIIGGRVNSAGNADAQAFNAQIEEWRHDPLLHRRLLAGTVKARLAAQ